VFFACLPRRGGACVAAWLARATGPATGTTRATGTGNGAEKVSALDAAVLIAVVTHDRPTILFTDWTDTLRKPCWPSQHLSRQVDGPRRR
jgi:hypothetical protein